MNIFNVYVKVMILLIYQKNSKKYKYNDKTLNFDEIDENYEYKCDNNDHCILGEDEKCKT